MSPDELNMFVALETSMCELGVNGIFFLVPLMFDKVYLYLNYMLSADKSHNKLDLRIGEPMQICIPRKDNLPKPVNQHLTLEEGAQGQI